MIRTLLAFVVLATAAVPALAQSPIQASHIEANVPAPEAFEPLLRRDLVAFFKTSVAPSVSRVEFKLPGKHYITKHRPSNSSSVLRRPVESAAESGRSEWFSVRACCSQSK